MSWMRYMTIKVILPAGNPDWKVKLILFFQSEYRVTVSHGVNRGSRLFLLYLTGLNYFDNINKLNIEIEGWEHAP